MSVTYHGTLEGVTLASGRYKRLPGVALGSVLGVGLVTAPTRAALEAGQFATLEGPHVLVSRVWYRRKRPGYVGDRWYHDLEGTAVRVEGEKVSFQPAGAVAHVCPALVGEFICGG